MTMNQNRMILEWLTEICEGTPIEGEGDDLEWLVQGKLGEMGLVVLKPRSKSYLQIQRLITIDPEHQAIIGRRGQERQVEFIYNMKRDLILTGVRWQLLFTDDTETSITEVRLSNRIYEDGLTRDSFIRSIYRLHDASILFVVNVRHMVTG